MNAFSEISQLLAPLATNEAARKFIRVEVGKDARLSPAELLFPVIFDPAFDRGPLEQFNEPPTSLNELEGSLRPLVVSSAQLVPFLVKICTEDFAYQMPFGPWGRELAAPILERVVRKMGSQSKWWSNVKYPSWAWEEGDFSDSFSWHSVTGHTFDCAVIAIGQDVTLTLLAFANS